jgi:hypothetical protein
MRPPAQIQKSRAVTRRVVSSVTDECATLSVIPDYVCGYRGFVLLPRREFDVERTPFGVDERVEFFGETTSRVQVIVIIQQLPGTPQ